MRTTEQRAKGKGQRATYPTKIAIFLITLSGLILEVGLTRIYSASIWYHFAFVAISVALLGWGLGGFTVHLLKQRMRLSMETAALVTLLYADAIPPAAFSSLRFAHRSLLQEFRNSQSEILIPAFWLSALCAKRLRNPNAKLKGWPTDV